MIINGKQIQGNRASMSNKYGQKKCKSNSEDAQAIYNIHTKNLVDWMKNLFAATIIKALFRNEFMKTRNGYNIFLRYTFLQ